MVSNGGIANTWGSIIIPNGVDNKKYLRPPTRHQYDFDFRPWFYNVFFWCLNLGYHSLYPWFSLSELCGSYVAPPKKCPPCAPPLWLVLQLICYQWCIRLQSGSCQSLVCVHKFLKNYPDNTTSRETQWITQKHANPHGNHRTTSPTWLDKICCKWGWGDIMYHDAGE